MAFYGRLLLKRAAKVQYNRNKTIFLVLLIADPTTTYRAPASIRREQKRTSIFSRSRIVVVSQSNRTQTVISITSVIVECVVVSSYRSRIAIVITA